MPTDVVNGPDLYRYYITILPLKIEIIITVFLINWFKFVN